MLGDLGVAWQPGKRFIAGLEKALGVRRLEDICIAAGVTRANADVPAQIRRVFANAGVEYVVRDAGSHAPVPADRPLIFYCNHPFGIADALIALELALARRPDTKVLANRTLGAFDLNTAHIIWVDPFEGASGGAVNQRGMREALRHLRDGGTLLMFPAGVCSHLRFRDGCITDPPWSQHLSRFIASTGACAVPVHFAGHNSWSFQLAGLVHPVLRTILLLREFVGLRGQRIDVRVGPVIAEAQLAYMAVDERTRHLRNVLYGLGRTGVERESAIPGKATASL